MMVRRLAKSSHQVKPINIGGFELHATGVTVHGRPPWGDYLGALAFSTRAHNASGFWLADLIVYGDSRPEWKAQIDAAAGIDELTPETVRQYRYVATRIPASSRLDAVPFGHHQAVAGLEPEDQREVLEQSASEGWNRTEVRRAVANKRRTRVLQGQAVLSGQYRVIYADPDYAGMTLEELSKLPVEAHTQPDAVLYCWSPVSRVLGHPGALEMVRSWGFTPKDQLVWDQVLPSPKAHYTNANHEVLIIATRGTCFPEGTTLPDSVIAVRRDGDGMEKPAIFRQIIEKCYPTGPKLELFARRAWPGWTAFGSDVHRWSEDARVSA